MQPARPSASLVGFALAILLVATPAVAGPLLTLPSVGEILVDGDGRVQGQNVAGVVGGAGGVIEDFTVRGSPLPVFDAVRVDGVPRDAPIDGIGTPTLSVTGSAAKVLLHDNLRSVLEVRSQQPTTVVYDLAAGIFASQEGEYGAIVQLTRGGETVGHVVAVGAEGARTRGETLGLREGEIVARLQSGSQLLFIGELPVVNAGAFHEVLVEALAEGLLVSHYVTEFEGSAVATSQVDAAEHASARTVADGRGAVETALSARGASVLVYELAYETLPAQSADDVAVFVDGELAQRAATPGDAFAKLKAGIPVYYAEGEGGRTRVIAASPEAGEHRIVVSVGAQASTEPQSRAENDGDGDARVYGRFEHHANGKLTGAFLTGVLPQDRALLLGFTALATRTEVFRNVTIDGGAAATFHAVGDEMRISTAKADLTLFDDAHATITLAAKAPVDARYELAPGVRARSVADGILALDGPHGPAGALLLIDERGEEAVCAGSATSTLSCGTLAADASGAVLARLAPGSILLYRATPDEHASEATLLRAIADGRLGAQLLAGVQDGALVTKATSYSEGVTATANAAGHAAIEIGYVANGEAARAFALDVRGAALSAQDAEDVRVLVDGVLLEPEATAGEALDAAGVPRYFAQTGPDGALRILVHTASAAGARSHIRIESVAEQSAREHAARDSFGVFRLFGDGSAVGSFVTLKADADAGAVSGLSTVARGEPVFASLVAGRSPYARVAGDGTTLLTLENREARIEVADSTNAFTKVVALAQTDAAFRLAAGLRAQERSSQVVDIVARDGAHVGSLVASQGALLVVRAEGDVRASLATGGEVLFRTHEGIESELSDAQRAMMNEAIAGGRVAGQVTLQATATATSAASASYGDVTMLTDATRERVEITIDSASEHGKTLIVSLDPQTIPGMARGKATIRFDGAFAGQASSYADVLDPSDDRGLAEYFVLAGDAGTQVLVSIPHFSVHTVTLEQDARGPDTWLLVATIFLGLVAIVQTVLLARKRRANNTIEPQRRP